MNNQRPANPKRVTLPLVLELVVAQNSRPELEARDSRLALSMPYYLGIDGGGTKTTCAVGDDARLLTTATAGPSNIVRVGETQARESLQQSVREACRTAGITPGQVVHTYVGGSGAARPELAATVRGFLAEILPTPIDVVGDMEIALEAAFDTGPGVIVNAGTGSFAYGRDPHGQTARAGGWGFAIGDEGSAHWIGREAVAAVLRDSDRSGLSPEEFVRSPLVTALCQAWKVQSLSDLARAANAVPPPDFAALSSTVIASKDKTVIQVLTRAGKELAEVAAIVMHRLFPANEIKTVPVATIGSVFRHASLVREVFYNDLRSIEPRAHVLPRVVEPVEGALRLARRAAKM
jgi:glucosamine kinase